ncbi:MAG TPA: hypothetical protein DDY32_07200 [Desulfobulbaceae bacterium]|nr:hypothetical protein [Desulfobulbaceae bacterium]
MEPGDLAAPGKPILTIEDPSAYKVTVELPQEELAGMARGTKVYLQNDGETITAAVTRIHPALGVSRLALLEAELPAAPFRLPSGASVGVELVRRMVAGRLVPENGVARGDKGPFVCVVEDGVVHIRPVTVLGSGQGLTAVQGELVPGEQCAVGHENRLLTLHEGSVVRVVAGGKR